MKKFLPNSKLEIKLLKKALSRGASISQSCREIGISRMTYYRWQERAKCFPKKLKPKKKKEQVLFEKRLLKLVISNPNLTFKELAQKLGKSQSFTWKILDKHSLGTRKLRRRWARKIGSYPVKKQKYRREFGIRVMLLEQAEEAGISRACREFGISRTLFYKWRKRHLAGESLEDREWKVLRWGRQTPEKYEQMVLDLVIRQPELSVHKIVPRLPKVVGAPVVGHHGVQNILRRNGLNTFDRRLEYARVHAPVSLVQPVTGWLNRLKTVFETFVPAIAPAPPPLLRRLADQGKLFLVSFLSSSVLTLIFLFWLSILSGQPTSVKLGLFFASISLTCGTFFFLYSMKYYFTLAVVLSFSRQPLGEGGGFAVGLNGRLNGNQKNGNGGWLARIFGLNGGNSGIGGNGRNGMVAAGGLQPSLDHIKLKRYPFVSIHLPFYNEKKVAERILAACSSFDYPSTRDARSGQVLPNFEIIVSDDSTDETTEIVQRYAKDHNQTHPDGPKIKVLHRPTREGFKGGALRLALSVCDPRTEFVVVFDADFIPYPDTLELFMKYFQSVAGTLDFADENRVAAVAGYQWHVLNKSENWITRGVRTEYAGSYVIERSGQEILGAMKLIHGSVYAIRADLLKKFGWGTSITEDFELTLKLYEQGYKVVYTPYVQAPAECASTIKRLIRQRMRWAEGHSHNIRKMFFRLLSTPNMNLPEKLEFLYLSPYYLQAFFFLIGTFSWLLAETVFRARLPFWTSLWGWSLVLTNFFSLPLVNAVGLFLEEAEEKDYLGIFSFVALSYLLVPFQAYASVKGFLEKEEGPWFRTPKTGLITDIFTRGRFYRWISGILPGRVAPAMRMVANEKARMYANNIRINSHNFNSPINSYLALGTANNRFDEPPVAPAKTADFSSFFGQSKQFAFLGIKVARRMVFSKATLALLLVVTMVLNYLAFFTVKTSEKSDKKEEIQAVQGGGTEIFRSEPVNTNLIENTEQRGTVQSSSESVVYAAESKRLASSGERLGVEEVYRWQVKLPRATYSFGLQDPSAGSGQVRPVVKMENEVRGGNFVRFTPDTRMGTNASAFGSLKRMLTNERMYIDPKVNGNSIEWEVRDGLIAKYTALADRIKADYIISDKSALISGNQLQFKVNYSDTEDSPRIFEQNKDGSISLIMDNYSEEIFRFLAPTVEDAEGKEGEAALKVEKTGQGTALLTITLDSAFLASATYPITIDPTTLNSAALSTATVYGSQRHIVRAPDGSLYAAYFVSSGTAIYISKSTDNGVTWTEKIPTISAWGSGSMAADPTSSDILYLARGNSSLGALYFYKYTWSSNSSSLVTLDTSIYHYHPSLIVTKMGSNDHVAVAWSFYGQDGGTKRGGARFMHCKISATNPCTSILNWCGANANGNGTDTSECGTAASGLAADGDADPIMVGVTKTARHVVLNQQSPTGTGTYAKDLVVVLGDDANNDLGTAYTGWGDTANCGDSTTNCWATWSSDVDNITGVGYDDADGYNLTLAQDNKSKELVLSWYRVAPGNELEVFRLGENDQPYAAAPWQDLTFPTGDNKDTTVGVDNTDGIYYNFYKNSSGYIAFRQADGVNFGNKLGYDTIGGSSLSLAETIRGSKFTLNTSETFTQIKAYLDLSIGNLVRVAIYNDDGGSPSKPSTLVVQSDASSSAGAGTSWGAKDINPTILSSGTYWLVVKRADTNSTNAYYTTGDTNQGISVSYSYANPFPYDFPSGATNDNNQYSIYAQVGWSGEIVLDQANADNAYPSVSEASDTTNKKMDLIYTGGTSPYSVYYHTWHFNQRYSHDAVLSAPTDYNDQKVFMDENEYNTQNADDTTYTSQGTIGGSTTNTGIFMFKMKNTNRSTYPDIDPTWEGCFARGSAADTIYLQIYNRDTASWETMDTDTSSSACSVEGDFKQLSPASTFSGAKYYFADDWVYFRVYVDNSDGTIPHTFYSDWFDTTNIWVPEKVILWLLLIPFIPKLIRRRFALISADKKQISADIILKGGR